MTLATLRPTGGLKEVIECHVCGATTRPVYSLDSPA